MTGSNRGSARRRRFLAGLAAASGTVVAGCSDLPWTDDETSATFTASAVDGVLADAAPSVERPVPVRPDASAVDGALERVDELLTGVPDPLSAETVPNGVVRKAVVDARDEATEIRTEAADATGPALYRAFRDSRTARSRARKAKTTLAAIDDETLVSELEDEHDTLEPEVRDQRGAMTYRGNAADDELLRSALYYARLESDLDRALESLRRWNSGEIATVIDVGEAAGDLESAAATASVREHCAERYEATIDDPVDLEPILRGALERSVDRADDVAFPTQGDDWVDEVGVGDIDETYVEHILWRAGDEVVEERDRLGTALTDGDLGTGLSHAVRFEQAFRAFEVVRDRVADGSVAIPETIDDVRSERGAAIAAAEAARDDITAPSLGAFVLAETVQQLRWADESVRRLADTDPDAAVSLTGEYGDYVRVRASLEVLPDAVDAVRTRLFEE